MAEVPDKVIVVLADDVESVLSEYEPLMEARGQRSEAPEIDRLRAALDRDPEELVERVAQTFVDHRWIRMGSLPGVAWSNEYLELARAVLAVLTEGGNGE